MPLSFPDQFIKINKRLNNLVLLLRIISLKGTLIGPLRDLLQEIDCKDRSADPRGRRGRQAALPRIPVRARSGRRVQVGAHGYETTKL